MAKSSQTNWHDECGKLYLCESLITNFNHYLACPHCCQSRASQAPLPYQSAHAFTRNQGGRSPTGTTRRFWSCRIAKSPQPVLSCKNFTVSEMLGICFAQLSVDHFEEAVQEVKALYDLNRPQHAGLKGWVVKHQQRLQTRGHPPSPTFSPAIHVQPAQVDLRDSDDAPALATKRKAADATGGTPTKAGRHARYNEKARDVFVDDSLLPLRPRSPTSAAPLPRLIQQAFDLQTQIEHHTHELSTTQAQLRSVLQAIEVQATLSTPADSFVSTPSSTPPPPTSSAPTVTSTTTTSTIAFTPPGKGKNRKPVEVTWIYAGCLLPEPSGMSPKERHDGIIKEAAKVYDTEELSRIIWARQLDDDDWTVELTVYKADVQRLYDTWVTKFGDDDVRLDLYDSLRDLHNPRYWNDFLAHNPTPDEIDDRTLIRRHDVGHLAQAWVCCGTKLVKTYIRRLCDEWQEPDLLYHEVGTYQLHNGTQLPDSA